MTLQQLQYVLTIAHEGSITKAARVLYKSQPNISNAVRELEQELQITIFSRTANGVMLTPEGEEFLLQAGDIVEQFDMLQSKYRCPQQDTFSFCISLSRSSYMIRGLSYWLDETVGEDRTMNVQLIETNANRVIEDISNGRSDLGIIRIPSEEQELLDSVLEGKHITQKLLMEFPLRLVFCKDHPLNRYDVVPYGKLEKYTEIIHGDDRVLALQKSQINPELDMRSKKRKVYVYDRGSQIDLLENIRGAYMWVSPIPLDMLEAHGMVLKDCDSAISRNRDILIYRKSNPRRALIRQCIQYLTAFAAELSGPG